MVTGSVVICDISTEICPLELCRCLCKAMALSSKHEGPFEVASKPGRYDRLSDPVLLVNPAALTRE